MWDCGLRVVSMDSSTTDVTDTDDNRTVFDGSGNDKRDGAFPQVRWVVAAESRTGVLDSATIDSHTAGEQSRSPCGPSGTTFAGHPTIRRRLTRKRQGV